jgi:hypothetical protein
MMTKVELMKAVELINNDELLLPNSSYIIFEVLTNLIMDLPIMGESLEKLVYATFVEINADNFKYLSIVVAAIPQIINYPMKGMTIMTFLARRNRYANKLLFKGVEKNTYNILIKLKQIGGDIYYNPYYNGKKYHSCIDIMPEIKDAVTYKD